MVLNSIDGFSINNCKLMYIHKLTLEFHFIPQVNGVNVMQSTHTEVVELIKCKLINDSFFFF